MGVEAVKVLLVEVDSKAYTVVELPAPPAVIWVPEPTDFQGLRIRVYRPVPSAATWPVYEFAGYRDEMEATK